MLAGIGGPHGWREHIPWTFGSGLRPERKPSRAATAARHTLACDAAHAKEHVYADGVDLAGAATPIGPTCRLCERLDCTHRAFPPLGQRLVLDENSRASSPFGLLRAAD